MVQLGVVLQFANGRILRIQNLVENGEACFHPWSCGIETSGAPKTFAVPSRWIRLALTILSRQRSNGRRYGFLRMLLTGKKVKAFVYNDRIKTRCYLRENAGELEELIYRMFSKVVGDRSDGRTRISITQNIYQSQLLHAVQEADVSTPALTSRIKKMNYGAGIGDIAQKINGDETKITKTTFTMKAFFENLYKSFNERKIDDVIEKMSPDVKWANGMDGGYVFTHEGVREYWTRQFLLVSSNVKPLDVGVENDVATIKVHQVVHDLNGKLLADALVTHVFHLKDGKIVQFDIF